MRNVRKQIEQVQEGFSGILGVAAKRLDAQDGELVSLNAETVFPTASVIKVPILVEVFRQVEKGDLFLDAQLPLKERDKVGGSGILKELHAGLELTLLDLAKLMIVISDNTATNMLIELVGRDSVNETMRKLGLHHTFLAGKLMVEANPIELSSSTPDEMLSLLIRIYNGEILSPDSCRQMLEIMKHQQYVTSMIGRYLPYDPDAIEEGEDSILIASKSGSIRGVRNDIGIIWGPNCTYAVAIMTKDCKDKRFYPDNEGGIVVAKISGILYGYYCQGNDKEQIEIGEGGK